MPPQLFARMRRTASSNSNDSKDTFDEYKVIIEEIKRAHPDLPPSAVQQMAVARLSSIKEKRGSRNKMNEMFAGMTNFRFGNGETASAPPPTSNGNDTNDPEGRRRRLNPRVSVPNIDTRGLSRSFLSGVSSDDEIDSLEDSLKNIEASTVTPSSRRQGSRRGSRRSLLMKRASLRSSMTELVDVEEDKELNASIPDTLAQSHQGSNSTKTGPGPQTTDLKISLSAELPDEIKVALGEYDNVDGQRSLGSDGKSEDRRRSSRVSEGNRSSVSSSFASVDSANFEGDFSAWGNKSGLR